MKIKTKLWIYPLVVIGFVSLLLNACSKSNDTIPVTQSPTSVTDIDGNVYQIVSIGTQTWMKQNLKVRHYRNGDSISYVTNAMSWNNLTTGACCDFNNVAANTTTYGKLYNFYAVNDVRKIAPVGWHVSTDAEWTTLKTFLGGENTAGGKLKEAGTSHWITPNTAATNSNGFTALPGGFRFSDGTFDVSSIGHTGLWWTSTVNASNAWYLTMNFDAAFVGRDSGVKGSGYSVRCVKD